MRRAGWPSGSLRSSPRPATTESIDARLLAVEAMRFKKASNSEQLAEVQRPPS
jgi:hypothetical protein